MHSSAFRLADRSSVSEVRRAAREHAEHLGWSDADRADGEIVATELATNLVKHGRDGVLAITSRSRPDGGDGEVLFLSVDRGPGMSDVEKCLRDGYSTAGSPGTGLGAVRRLAQHFDVWSGAEGTVVAAELVRGRRSAGDGVGAPLPFRLGVLSLAKEGQSVSGDGWMCRPHRRGLAVLVCDGLGHGQEAGTAARRAIERFLGGRWDSPKDALESIDEGLRGTRGAAAAVAVIDAAEKRVMFGGVGNISAGVYGAGRARHMVSMNGILGATSHRVMEFEYPWSDDAVLLMHSDGVSARWQQDRWPALWSRHPGVIAGVVYRDCARGTDDAVIVAVAGK